MLNTAAERCSIAAHPVPDETTLTGPNWLARGSPRGSPPPLLALVIAWSVAEPERTGEVALLHHEGRSLILGRGEQTDDDPPLSRVRFSRHRAGWVDPTGPLQGPGMSRRQLVVEPRAGELRVARLGKRRLLVNGVALDSAVVRPGDTVHIENQLLLLCARRAREVPRQGCEPTFPFGRADADGMVGESPASFEVREQIAFCARRPGHVLIVGASGSGKEIAARAIHRLSSRAALPLCARNAATLPPGLIDAELFGNERNYPNPGMRERPGLLGEADGSTLFLDEVGELPAELQAHLLRVLDAGGEYQRLGESRTRTTDIRMVAATNRPPTDLKHDFVSRFPFRLTVPGLGERREDIPLLIRHMLRDAASNDPSLGARFFDDWDGASGEPRIDPALVDGLVRHAYTHHVRELARLLWTAIRSSESHYVAFSDAVRSELSPTPPPALHVIVQPAMDPSDGPGEPCASGAPAAALSEDGPPPQGALRRDVEQVERARIMRELAHCGWNQRLAAAKLGIARGTLIKKLKAFGIKRPDQ
jgi:two-component system nitrogen regulation response regulator GlnG/two-component system response regulator HydG